MFNGFSGQFSVAKKCRPNQLSASASRKWRWRTFWLCVWECVSIKRKNLGMIESLLSSALKIDTQKACYVTSSIATTKSPDKFKDIQYVVRKYAPSPFVTQWFNLRWPCQQAIQTRTKENRLDALSLANRNGEMQIENRINIHRSKCLSPNNVALSFSTYRILVNHVENRN